MDRHQFNRLLAEAAREMAAEESTELTLQRAIQMATDLVEHCDLAGVSLVHPEGVRSPAASVVELQHAIERQQELREGPCMEAMQSSDVVTSGNLPEDHRFPTWGALVADELGLHSAMSMRLFTHRGSMGALNLYAREVNAFTHDDLLDGLIVAAHTAAALAATMEVDQLHEALETRRLIGEATGIVRERFGLDSDQAFAVLRRISSQQNLKLHLVAQQLIDTGALPSNSG